MHGSKTYPYCFRLEAARLYSINVTSQASHSARPKVQHLMKYFVYYDAVFATIVGPWRRATVSVASVLLASRHGRLTRNVMTWTSGASGLVTIPPSFFSHHEQSAHFQLSSFLHQESVVDFNAKSFSRSAWPRRMDPYPPMSGRLVRQVGVTRNRYLCARS